MDTVTVLEQSLPVGPMASQDAIKQLGTNGGGFFNVNSAHPFENPTPLSNFLEMLAILLIPAALCYTFGEMVGDRRQGWALLAAMLILPGAPPPVLRLAGAERQPRPGALQPGGNMEGKEVRFGIANSALWATATTAASNGSVNAMHDSFTPLGGLVPLLLMQLGEVVFGGVGSGLYGMLVFAIIAVFIAGLMVGRTPEYLGKKIEAYEMKMASLVILIPVVHPGRHRRSRCTKAGKAGVANPGAHGFSEILYAFSSGRQQQRQRVRRPQRQHALLQHGARHRHADRALLDDRAGAGHRGLAGRRRRSRAGERGHLPTHTPLFVALLVGVVLIVGALTFFPALALGPIVEHLVVALRAKDDQCTRHLNL